MSKIKGVYAASMSVINKDLTLDVKKTIEHAEMVIDQGCHGMAIFGSTGQAQLIPVAEKINLLNQLSISKYKEKYRGDSLTPFVAYQGQDKNGSLSWLSTFRVLVECNACVLWQSGSSLIETG